MTAEDNEPRDEETTETEAGDHESADDEGTAGTEPTGATAADRPDEDDDDSDDDSDDEGSEHDDEDDDEADDEAEDESDDHEAGEDSDDESDDDEADDDRVKKRGTYDADTPGVTDARPGRDDIGESQMPSDYHQAVAERPVEVNLPDTPDLSEEGGSDRDD